MYLKLKFYFRKFPYLDSSIVLGYKSDLLRVLPQDLANLQTFLSDQFLAGGSDILVDTSGEKISTIGEDNFQLGNAIIVVLTAPVWNECNYKHFDNINQPKFVLKFTVNN